MTTQPDTLAARLKARREQMRYSQAALAELVGKSQSTIGDWELGRSRPSLVMIEHLARILETTPGWLAFGASEAAA